MRVIFCLLALAAGGGAATARYTISLHDRAVEVEARFPAAPAGSVKFRLHSWAGHDYFQDVSQVSAAGLGGGALTLEAAGDGEWTVRNAGRPFTLRWRVQNSKNAMIESASGSQFHITVLKDWAVMWGHAFVLAPEDESLARAPAQVRVRTNEYGRWDSTLPAGGELAHLSDLADQLIVAGAFRVYREPGRRYYFATSQKVVADRDLMQAVDRTFAAQRRYMGVSPSRAPLFVFTDGRAGSSGGTVVRNSAVFYPDLTRELAGGNYGALRLVAHEIFHLWNGSKMEEKYDAAWSDGKYGWFKEGFTEYYSGATLYREGILDEAGFAEFLNGKIAEYAQNGESQRATLEVMGSQHWRDRDHQQLPYTKGALIALLMDLQLRARGHKLDDYMRAMLRRHPYGLPELREEWVKLAGEAGARFWDGYIPTAAALPLAEIFRAAGISFAEREIPLFELGFTFDRQVMERGAKVTGVTSGSNAAKAGVQTGDVLQGFSVYHSDPEKPAKFTLLRGEEKVNVSYSPWVERRIVQVEGELRGLR